MPKILLIEDNPEIRESMAEILELSGYEIFKAHNGKIGVTKARETKPDLIICDVMMPELDGFGVISLLSKDPETQQIPFIFLTSKMDPKDIRKGMNLGADDYLTKPFELSELLNAIDLRLEKAHKRAPQIVEPNINLSIGSSQKGKYQFEEWVKSYDELHFASKQVFFEAGSSPSSFYWLTEGIVQLQSEPSPGRVFMRDLQQSPIFLGLSALLAAKPQTESAISMTKGKMRLIPIADFESFLQTKPLVMQYIIHYIASETLAQQALQAEYSFASVRKRVALSLCRIHDIFGDQEVDFPREVLASFSAVSRGGLMRVLAQFREDDLLETENTKLKVTNYQALSQIID